MHRLKPGRRRGVGTIPLCNLRAQQHATLNLTAPAAGHARLGSEKHEMRARVNGVDLFFDVEGCGVVVDGPRTVDRPALIALHGGPARDHTTLKPYLSPLTDVAQLVYVDHRGTGRSGPADPSSYRLPQLADDIDALRRHLGLDTIILLGHSYGGFIALTYALRHPETLSHLILVGTAPSHRFWERSAEILRASGTCEQQRLGPKLLAGEIATDDEYRGWWRTMLPLYYTQPDSDAINDSVQRVRGNVRTAQEMLRHDLPQYDVEAELHTITVPTLVATGVHDWIQPTEYSRLLATELPHATLKVYERSGHVPHAEENAKFIADVTEFLGK